MRRPWLAANELKETFHRMTARSHPDVTGAGNESAELNAAFATLRDPAARLRHLLELEHPEALAKHRAVPPGLAEMFLRLATLRRAVDAFVEQQSSASSPLSQALMASEKFALQRDVEKAQQAVEAAHARCLEELEALDRDWENRTPQTVERAAELQQELAYLAKWGWQLREGLFRLGT